MLDASNTQASEGLESRLSNDWKMGGVFGYGTSGLSTDQFSNVSIDTDPIAPFSSGRWIAPPRRDGLAMASTWP